MSSVVPAAALVRPHDSKEDPPPGYRSAGSDWSSPVVRSPPESPHQGMHCGPIAGYQRAVAPGRPRVLLYTGVAAVGGAEKALGYLVAGLGDRYEVHLAGRYAPVLDRLAGHTPGSGYHTTGAGVLAHLRLLRRVRPDLVQVNLEVPWAGYPMLAAALAVPRLRVVAAQPWAARPVDTRPLLRPRALALRLAAHVAVSPDAARRVEDFYALGRGSVTVIHNGVPAVPPVASRATGDLVVGCVGRLDR